MAEPSFVSSSSNSRELECVGTLQIATPKSVGFLCGSIPVPTDQSFHAYKSALLRTPQSVSTPRYRYRMLPTETDLNTPPLLTNFPEKSRTSGDLPWDAAAVASNLTRKSEALAVSGLVEYGDEVDVIAPTDILKQIFKMPYSKARLSIAVHRIGQTLVLNTGPDVEEGEKLIRRHGNQSKHADQSMLLNFAMHSVRMEACDCPPSHQVPSHKKSSSSLLGGNTPHYVGQGNDIQSERYDHRSECPQIKKDTSIWESKKSKRSKTRDPVKKTSQVGEKTRCSVQEPEMQRKIGNEGFMRVLFWQFHNFRMLLGSDLLLFSNEKYIAVSLHLWDVTRPVTSLTWLEAWLDNFMASVPELAICYHLNGVVQGYELLKTHDIFLLKGISEDGTPAFDPYVVEQNGLSVLRFLQENCKQDPGAYWLYKSTGEDVIQLFDLSVMPKNKSSKDCDHSLSSLPSLMSGRRSDSVYSLGTLLYRIAHRLSLSMSPKKRARCVKFFKKCLDFLDDPDYLGVRAIAHEQFARLLLGYEGNLDLTSEYLPLEYEVTLTEADETSLNINASNFESFTPEDVSSMHVKDMSGEDRNNLPDLDLETSTKAILVANGPVSPKLIAVGDIEVGDPNGMLTSSVHDSFSMCKVSQDPTHVVQTITDPISSKLAAIHHVSLAIKSLRWMRQLQTTDSELMEQYGEDHIPPASFDGDVCACGDTDCIEVCDIRQWLPKSKLDRRLWKLVLLLGESYLALGQTYKEDGQLHQALKVIQLACSVYGSMPSHFEDAMFISSMISCTSSYSKSFDEHHKPKLTGDSVRDEDSCSVNDILTLDQRGCTYLFWAKAWTLVGDVHVEFHMINGKGISIQSEDKSMGKKLRMSSDVIKEVKRLRKKLAQFNKSCSSCSLVNCSCQSDRASSGSSASSSGSEPSPAAYLGKHTKKFHARREMHSRIKETCDEHSHNKVANKKHSDHESPHVARCQIQAPNTETPHTKSIPDTHLEHLECSGGIPKDASSNAESQAKMTSEEAPELENGGIFKYLGIPFVGSVDHNLSAALRCYEEARKALMAYPIGVSELQSILKKKGWVYNELGRIRLERKQLKEAEVAFIDAIHAFREVSDHNNVILINCNLGHGRRALAEEMVTKMEELKLHSILKNAYKKALETAKLEYAESLRYYGAAKSELNAISEDIDIVASSLRNEVCTQFAHTYLRFGMLLAREDTTSDVYENGFWEGPSVSMGPHDTKARKELRKHEISANDAIREALCIYESLGELRKQEAAYAYFQLACYQRDCCLKFMDLNAKKSTSAKGENVLQRVKRYASLAERNWEKAMDFYGPKTHPAMYITILIERSELLLNISGPLHSNMMLESAVARMLEGRHVTNPDSDVDAFFTNYPDLHAKFWSQLQMLLKKMLGMTLSTSASKISGNQSSSKSNKCGDGGKIRELYKISLKTTGMNQLHAMHQLWTS